MGPTTTLTVLGSGTLLPDPSRHAAAYHVECGDVRLLVDCGMGTIDGLARYGVAWAELTHVAISHYHNDHVGDLSNLLFVLKYGLRPPRTRPLTLVGPAGFRAFAERLDAALGDHLLDPGFDVGVVEVGGDAWLEAGGVRLRAHPTPHTDESVAFRLETPAGTIGYTGDSGPSDDVARFLEGCALLVSECALTDPPEMDLHLSPSGVAALARIARPELLMLTHVYPPLTPTEAVALVREGWPGRVVAGVDGMRVGISGGRASVDRSTAPG